MPKHHELCTRLENAATRGNLNKVLWMTHCHFEKLLREGHCEGKILEHAKNPKNPLVKVHISWKNACEGVNPQKLQEYIEGKIVTTPNFAFKLYIMACRAQQKNS